MHSAPCLPCESKVTSAAAQLCVLPFGFTYSLYIILPVPSWKQKAECTFCTEAHIVSAVESENRTQFTLIYRIG